MILEGKDLVVTRWSKRDIKAILTGLFDRMRLKQLHCYDHARMQQKLAVDFLLVVPSELWMFFIFRCIPVHPGSL